MCVPRPIIPLRAPLQPVEVIHSGRGGEIDVLYICCLDNRVPEAYEHCCLAEDGVPEVRPYATFKLLSEFSEDTFHTQSFNARRFHIPFLGCISVNMSVEFIDVVRTTQHV